LKIPHHISEKGRKKIEKTSLTYQTGIKVHHGQYFRDWCFQTDDSSLCRGSSTKKIRKKIRKKSEKNQKKSEKKSEKKIRKNQKSARKT
jgi:hypothetical protein